MSDHLPIPPELEHLIEKRQEEDRRKSGRRGQEDRRVVDLGPGACRELKDGSEQPPRERRSGVERRQAGDRRKRARRQAGPPPPEEP